KADQALGLACRLFDDLDGAPMMTAADHRGHPGPAGDLGFSREAGRTEDRVRQPPLSPIAGRWPGAAGHSYATWRRLASSKITRQSCGGFRKPLIRPSNPKSDARRIGLAELPVAGQRP